MTADRFHHTDVIVVGAGPVGLMAGLLLERFGVRTVVFERGETVGRLPRARGYNQRTMEIFRQCGLEEAIRPATARTEEMVFMDSVVGREHGRTRPEPDLGQTPTWKAMVPQDLVEAAMLERLTDASHVDLRFSTEVVAVEHDERGVAVRTRTGSGEERWTAEYLIAADGARSLVRQALEIEMAGQETLAYGFSQRWTTDRARLPSHAQPEVANRIGAFFIVSDDPEMPPTSPVVNDYGDDRWLSLFTGVDPKGRGESTFTDAEVVGRIRRQIGIPDLDVTLLDSSTYRISDVVAERYRSGRVFLAGDAAHQFPPTGIGLNTGLQDAHNLVWKLALVLRGHAGDALLDSYDAERRPVALANAAWSTANAQRLTAAVQRRQAPPILDAVRSGDPDRIRFAIRELEHHTHWAGQALGFGYEAGALLPDGSMPEAQSPRLYVPTDRPGARFPHLWVDPTGTTSTLDWFDTDLTVVAGPDGAEWLEAAGQVARRLGLPLRAHQLPEADPERGFHLGRRGAVVVRPDGHVAWRMPGGASDRVQELGSAVDAVLG